MKARNTRLTSSTAGFTAAIRYSVLAVAMTALGTIGAAPAQAAVHHAKHHRVVSSPAQLQMYAPDAMNAERSKAVQECNADAAKWSNNTWESTQLAAYGTCMTEHGQIP
jgi:hypothetical protein